MKSISVDNVRIIALDLETTGLIPGKHVPISIGAVKMDLDHDIINSRNSFYVQLEWDSLTVDPSALRINRLDIVNPPGRNESFYRRSLPVIEGIGTFLTWLDMSDETPILALGKNVGSFDLPMLKSIWNVGLNRNWPFHYRSIDINTLFVALSSLTNSPIDTVKNRITQKVWEMMTEQRIEDAGESWSFLHREHNAFSDAWWNVYAWKECLKELGDFEVLT